MSGGRVELGLGAGWYEAEHTAYGIPFPPLGERFDRLEEQLADHHRPVGDAGGRDRSTSRASTTRSTTRPALPKPVQKPGPPIIIGGGGTRAHARPGGRASPTSSTSRSRPATDFAPAVRPGRGRLRGRRPRPGDHALVGGADGVLRRRRGGVRAPGRGHRPRRRRAARQRRSAARPRRSSKPRASAAEAGAERVYLQVLDLADLDHVAFLGETSWSGDRAAKSGARTGGRRGPGRAGVEGQADGGGHQAEGGQRPPQRVDVLDRVTGHEPADQHDGDGDADGSRQADEVWTPPRRRRSALGTPWTAALWKSGKTRPMPVPSRSTPGSHTVAISGSGPMPTASHTAPRAKIRAPGTITARCP